MAISISGSVSLTYGEFTQDETFDTTGDELSFANTSNQHIAGQGRATSTGVALEQGAVGTEGLLLIKNTNTVGDLLIALDGDGNYDIKIPPETVNLISVGTEGVPYIKTAAANDATQGVTSATSAGLITFDGGHTVATAGTYVMTATSAGTPDHSGAGPSYILKVATDGALIGYAYELDGTTIKDLSAVYTSGTVTALVALVDYRYVLTEK
tara:strand:+ start:344 stop:976 length:633 start_codon:yes stop_codon:yes gene_type:complete